MAHPVDGRLAEPGTVQRLESCTLSFPG